MERNTKTTISQLQPGDRFYKCNDKKKILWTMADVQGLDFKRYRHAIEDGQRFPNAIKINTEVIFLRHANRLQRISSQLEKH